MVAGRHRREIRRKQKKESEMFDGSWYTHLMTE